MASIFTFDPDPPRVSSPWSTPTASSPRGKPVAAVTRLEAEPQEGPTEYKLHLLLRPRREYVSASTGLKISGSYRSVSASPKVRAASETGNDRLSPLQPRYTQTRQQRLEQLTTQLLWRLQQSCPVHTTSINNQITPVFPNAGDMETDPEIGPLIPGLEESRGALYEIGVADDGTFVGLAEDEMNESLRTLRAMAASLGCVVEMQRMVSVGDCEWYDYGTDEQLEGLRQDKLWVAEAYVKPDLSSDRLYAQAHGANQADHHASIHASGQMFRDVFQSSTQLKVSLTGATMSGKSTLLGSLTTATLDNGRGKSRLNLLKHRHEIVSGMTSSVTQELVGYTQEHAGTVQVINYASDNVSTWTDIHGICTSGRLVLLSDSAGHPRYRRTTLRGLIGWSPDWTLLCIPADNAEDTSGMVGSTPTAEEVLGVGSVDVDLSQAHLELCLKLNLRLVVVVTKFDLASKAGLRQSLTKVLSTLKAAGRTPKILANPTSPEEEAGLMSIPANIYKSCKDVTSLLYDARVVPIVLTSAVKGTGISTLHALLCTLPAPGSQEEESQPDPTTLFHIEDTYHNQNTREQQPHLPVLSGILTRGEIKIGDELLLGPFATELVSEQRSPRNESIDRPSIPTSRSFPGALTAAKSLPATMRSKEHEWLKVRISSLRHLRQPVTALIGGQVGTAGIAFATSTKLPELSTRIRKGMILASGTPQSRRGFIAEFARSDVDGLSIGMGVVVYVSSVRASAKVVAGAIPDDHLDSSIESLQALTTGDEDDGGFFRFDDDDDALRRTQDKDGRIARLHVTFQFIASKEYIDIGSMVLITPGGGPGLSAGNERGEKGMAGLEGFVGTIIDGY